MIAIGFVIIRIQRLTAPTPAISNVRCMFVSWYCVGWRLLRFDRGWSFGGILAFSLFVCGRVWRYLTSG